MTADAPAAWLTLLRDLSVKSALLLLSAWALTLAMRHASASTRHLVWLLVFAGLLALPLLSLTLPARSVLVLPAALVAAAVSTPIAAAPPAVPGRLPAPSVATTSPAVCPVPPAPPVRLPLLCLFWLLGAVLFSVPIILGLALAGKRIRSCRPVADPAVLALRFPALRLILELPQYAVARLDVVPFVQIRCLIKRAAFVGVQVADLYQRAGGGDGLV